MFDTFFRRFSRHVLVAFAGLMLLAAWGARRAHDVRDNSVLGWLPERSPVTIAYRKFLRVFGPDEAVLASWEGCDLDAAALEDLARAVEGQVAARQGIDILLLGYAVALVFRVAQGSATVAMQMASVTCAGLVPLLECHPIYLFLAIGFGATGFSWMNDSGFWVVSRLAGFTERETLRTWTPLLTAISVTGLAITLAAARLVPLPPPAAAAAQVAPR